MSIPLVQNNEKDSINTSIIAIKKNLERINSILGLVDSGSDIDTSEFVKKSDIVDVVQSGNFQPVTSNAVATSNAMPVDTVTSGDMHSVTSNAVYQHYLSYRNFVFSNDTRSVNSTPQEYMRNYNRGLVVEFKLVSAIGSPGIGSIFCQLFTCVIWSDSSGGYPMQFAVGNGKIAKRTGSSNTTWGGWSILH